MQKDIASIVVSKDEISKMVKNLGSRISKDYEGKELVLVCVLKGGVAFLSDLMKEITIPIELDFISVSSYGDSTKSSGVVRLIKDLDVDVTNKHVLFIEDIIDTGLTLNHLKELFSTRNPKSVKVCTALDKPSRRKINIEIDYKGIEIPDKFVVGYGLDYKGKYRNLPEVCELKHEVYTTR